MICTKIWDRSLGLKPFHTKQNLYCVHLVFSKRPQEKTFFVIQEIRLKIILCNFKSEDRQKIVSFN